MWSPAPSVFSLLVSRLEDLSPTLASEYPALHHALLHALYQDCHMSVSSLIQCTPYVCDSVFPSLSLSLSLNHNNSNGYYIPGTGGSGVSVGVASLNSTHSQSGSITKVLDLLTKQMQLFTLSFDTWSVLIELGQSYALLCCTFSWHTSVRY